MGVLSLPKVVLTLYFPQKMSNYNSRIATTLPVKKFRKFLNRNYPQSHQKNHTDVLISYNNMLSSTNDGITRFRTCAGNSLPVELDTHIAT